MLACIPVWLVKSAINMDFKLKLYKFLLFALEKKKKAAEHIYADRLNHNYGLIFAHLFCMVKTGSIN